MRLDSRLNFKAQIIKRLKRKMLAEAKIKKLSKIYGLSLALVRQIKVAKVQSVALYGTNI